jgi:Fe-S cluster assembly protein SufD
MTTIQNFKTGFLTEFEQLENKNGLLPDFVQTIRREAMHSFMQLPIPTFKHEEWKYTNLHKLTKHSFAKSASTITEKALIEPYWIPDLEGNQLVFVNGAFQPSLSSIISHEIIIEDLEQAFTQYEEVIKAHFSKHLNIQEEIFTALNTAFAQKGIFIQIPKDKVIAEPIVLYFLTDAREQNTTSQPHHLILVEENSQATLVEKYDTLGSFASFNNTIHEIFVGNHAILKHYKIQNDQPSSFYVGTTQVQQASQSVYTNITITLNGSLVRNNLNIRLDGEYTEGNMYGLYMLKEESLVDNHTVVDHLKPHCLSNELYKGIMQDRSVGVFNGKIFVRQDAQKTNAYQQNRNVLLSENASVNTKPQLEIWADDVKCSHGATTGSLDETSLFYLRSRGIPEKEAKALLVNAFAHEITEKIDIEALKVYLEAKILERLEQ